MVVHYDRDVPIGDRIRTTYKLKAAAYLVDSHASKLSEADKVAISAITSMYIVDRKGEYLGQRGYGVTLCIAYINAASAAWLGTIWGHEGQHYLNRGKYSGSSRWRDERTAALRQIDIGEKIGLSPREIDYLRAYSSLENSRDLGRHMRAGYECGG
jgi:hypothetical protein